MTSRDAIKILQNLLLNPSRPNCNTPLSWLFKQQLLQESQNYLRTEMFLNNPNQIWSETAAGLDPHYSLILERGLLLKTQAFTALAYHEAFQRIQDEESLFLTQLRRGRRIDGATNIPLEIIIQQIVTLEAEKDEGLNTNKDTNTNSCSQQDPTHTFPSILHEILSNPDYSEIITWLPHGRAWRIICRTQFERVIIPRHFRHGRYSSFMRQVRNGEMMSLSFLMISCVYFFK